MPKLEQVDGQSSADLFGAGKYAMITNGSWMINTMYGYDGVETGSGADADRPERQAGQHVQRAGRLDLGRLGQQGRRGQVGRVPRLAGLPEHRR